MTPVGKKAHSINFSIAGKAGETKQISHTPSEDGVLRLFIASKIIASDSSKVPGEGTFIHAVRSGDHWPISYGGGKTIHYAAGSLHDSCFATRCHPRLPVTAVVEFYEDCTWRGVLIGHSIIVPDEGVYAITPSVPCTAEIPEGYRDCQRSNGWYQGIELDQHRRTACPQCWFNYGSHPKWPWRHRDHLLEAIVAPGMQDFFITAERRSVLRRMRVDGYPDGPFTATEAYLKTKFRLRAFGRVGHEEPLHYSRDEKGPWACFGIGCLSGVILDAGEQLHVRVENVASKPLLFKASVSGDEQAT